MASSSGTSQQVLHLLYCLNAARACPGNKAAVSCLKRHYCHNQSYDSYVTIHANAAALVLTSEQRVPIT